MTAHAHAGLPPGASRAQALLEELHHALETADAARCAAVVEMLGQLIQQDAHAWPQPMRAQVQQAVRGFLAVATRTRDAVEARTRSMGTARGALRHYHQDRPGHP